MQKKHVLVYLLFFNIISFCQEKKSGEVVYVASIDMSILGNYMTKAPKEFHAQINETLNNLKTLNYFLIFNDKQSSFFKEKKLENDEKKRNLTEIKAGKGLYYTDSNKNEILHQKNAFGEQFLIRYPLINWKITNERKKIGKYLCYKATTKKTIESRRGLKKINVEAWYTTDIPLNYGPKNYNGLPGLIISLKEGSLLFSAKTIKFNKKNIEIKKPTKGLKIKLEEYDEMVKKMFSGQKRN